MDQVVGQALATFRRINEALPAGADTAGVECRAGSGKGVVSTPPRLPERRRGGCANAT